jgi:hypothetical protein
VENRLARALLVSGALLSSAPSAHAQRALLAAPAEGALALPADTFGGRDSPERDQGGSDVQRGPLLPLHLAKPKTTFWSIGVGLERFGRDIKDTNDLIGVAAMLRIRSFGPHALVMAKPSQEGYEDSRFLGGLGLRGYFPLLGISFSYGVGFHAEVRLEDHFWLAYATPLELGVVLYAKNSWDIELFMGARRAFAGELINHFLIDPNGFDNENAQRELDRTKTDDPWRGFVRIVFARRID